MEKDKIEFFVLKGTEEERDITKMIECLDEKKGEYIINYLTKNSETINNYYSHLNISRECEWDE